MMEVLKTTELEDGGAVLEMSMSKEEVEFIINFGFVELLKKGMAIFEENFEKGNKK
jgi:hypothetical protein